MFDCELFNIDEDRVRDLLVHPCAAVGLGDVGAHLAYLCDAGFGLHLLGHWVRERGDLTLEQGVQMVTSRLADAYRISNRGRLVPGASRVDIPPLGLKGVWVNGQRVVSESGPIANCGKPGELIRHFPA